MLKNVEHIKLKFPQWAEETVLVQAITFTCNSLLRPEDKILLEVRIELCFLYEVPSPTLFNINFLIIDHSGQRVPTSTPLCQKRNGYFNRKSMQIK